MARDLGLAPAPAAATVAGDLPAWYLACSASELSPGEIVSAALGSTPIVVYRGRSGGVYALSAHCSHMGTHLGHGRVIGDRLRCPLHHWEFDGGGACRRSGGGRSPAGLRQVGYPVAERFGAVFVFSEPEAAFPPPEFAGARPEELRALPGGTVEIACPWTALAANGFDSQHFTSVHERAFREPPRVERIEDHRLELRYVSRVTGRSAADRAVRWLSRDRIEAVVTCWGGPVVLVETRLGRFRSYLLLTLLPIPGGTRVRPIFAVRRSSVPALDALRLRVSRRLFESFLRRDVAFMDGMRFAPRVTAEEDPVLAAFLHFLSARGR